jgi:serine/threonine-protein kinase
MPLAVGAVFAGYNILQVLGAGAMGTVYLAQHPRLPRRDALKVLSPELTADPLFRARFVREADIAASLRHPNILGIHDRGECDGQFWISMDYVEGTDAAQLLRQRYPGGMPVTLTVQIVTAVGSALDHAHQRGLLHRDVKPSNILIADPELESQWVFLADFGIARPVDDTAGLTATNMTIGTVAYAAPEQLMGQPLDGRADQYALACSAFHLLTGSQPYDFSSAAVVITQHVMAPPPPIGQRRRELAVLDSVFARAMAKKPSERFARCQDFSTELQRALGSGVDGTQPALRPVEVPAAHETQVAGAGYASRPPPSLPSMPSTPPPAGRRRGRRTGLLVGAVVAVALLVAGGILAVIKLTGGHNTTAAAPSSSAPPATGPFTGTYRADYDAKTGLDGAPFDGAKPSTETWGMRSVCKPSGCVATATRLGGDTTTLTAMVFDDIGGHWLAVAVTTAKCFDVTTEAWEVLILQPRPDSTLVGEYDRTTPNGCASKRIMTFTRTGGVDVNGIADPASQAPRIASPAEALHGRYHSTTTWATGQEPSQDDYSVRTDCLRTSDRCMSFFQGPPGKKTPLVFGSGNWLEVLEWESDCPSGGKRKAKETVAFALPQPPQDPITLLTGHGNQQQTGSCSANVEFDRKFERTGD